MNNHQIQLLFDAMGSDIPLKEKTRESLQKHARCKNFKKEQHVSKEGDHLTEIFFIISGIYRSYYLDASGNEWNKNFHTKGDFIGASISPDVKSVIYQQCIYPGVVLAIPYQCFKESNELMTLFKILLNRKLERKQQREMQLLANTAAENYRIFQEEFTNFSNQISQFHIASYLGITPTQLSRLRKKEKSQHM